MDPVTPNSVPPSAPNNHDKHKAGVAKERAQLLSDLQRETQPNPEQLAREASPEPDRFILCERSVLAPKKFRPSLVYDIQDTTQTDAEGEFLAVARFEHKDIAEFACKAMNAHADEHGLYCIPARPVPADILAERDRVLDAAIDRGLARDVGLISGPRKAAGGTDALPLVVDRHGEETPFSRMLRGSILTERA